MVVESGIPKNEQVSSQLFHSDEGIVSVSGCVEMRDRAGATSITALSAWVFLDLLRKKTGFPRLKSGLLLDLLA
jgi:hypothetical protein